MAAWLALSALPLAGHAAAFDLQQLTTLLSQTRRSEAVFTETRNVAMLDRTLESSGRLSFSAPDTFVRETLKPRHEKLAVVGDRVTLTSGGRSRSMRLDAIPEAAILVEAIRGTLTGNREVLERHFSATVSGQPQRWMLELVPIEPSLRELVKAVQLSGRQAVVSQVKVAMADGDSSVMHIEPVATPSAPAASTPN